MNKGDAVSKLFLPDTDPPFKILRKRPPMRSSTEYNVLQELSTTILRMVMKGYPTLADAKKALLEFEAEGQNNLVIQKVERTQYNRSDLGLME